MLASSSLASMTFFFAVYCGNRLKFWNTRPKCSRLRRIWLSFCVFKSAASKSVWPATVIVPASGTVKKFRQRSSVVLPEPDEPMMATDSPDSSEKSMPRSTCVFLPKDFSKPCTSNIAIKVPPYALK